MFPSRRIDLQREQCLKGAMQDAQVTTGAIIFNDSHHGLTHAYGFSWMAIMLCLHKLSRFGFAVVKFIGSPLQPRYRGEVDD